MKTVHRIGLALALALLCLGSACNRQDSGRLQGYVEGEFVYVASPGAGKLETLHVARGSQVKNGDPLFAIESVSERAARDEAARRLAQASANLEDLKKGKRPTEIAAIESQLQQAQAALILSEKQLKRQQELYKSGSSAVQDLDRARSAHDQDRQRVAQLEADLKTAQLGSRTDQIAAAEANVNALESALARTEWDLSQKQQSATQDSLVFDTIYRVGEWVPAGRPVVSLLPPANIKVRAFVPEHRVGSLHVGDSVRTHVDGVGNPFSGRISFISPQAEYTPPVIYSQESRTKLVFMIEIVFDSGTAAKLHPGQPVDVETGN
jgi:HlyD family secretion protein